MKSLLALAAIFAVVVFVTGCDKPSAKLAVLDGVTYIGDAQPRQVMGVTMFGRYKLKFSKDAEGQMKCSLTVTIHDGVHGWGQPEVTEIKNLLFEQGVEDRMLLHRDPEISALGSIKSGQVPDSLTMFNENLDEIKMSKVNVSAGAEEKKSAKIPPTVLMTREKFEGIFGKPSLTSDEVDKIFQDNLGYTLTEFVGAMSKNNFDLPEESRERFGKPLPSNYDKFEQLKTAFNRIYADTLPNRTQADTLPDRLKDLCWHGIADFKSEHKNWSDYMIYHLWLITRQQGITNVSFAEYGTSDSRIRAFFVGDKLFLMFEYRTKQVPSSDWSAWTNRFFQIEGGAPLLVRTNIGLPENPTPSKEAPLNLCSSYFVWEGNYPRNVSILGTNYFAQLVSNGEQYGPDSEKHKTDLIIGDASFLYPIAIEDTGDNWRFEKHYAAQRQADTDAILRQADRENARAAVLEELRRKAQ